MSFTKTNVFKLSDDIKVSFQVRYLELIMRIGYVVPAKACVSSVAQHLMRQLCSARASASIDSVSDVKVFRAGTPQGAMVLCTHGTFKL